MGLVCDRGVMSNFEPLITQPVASVETYPERETGRFRTAWLTGMVIQLMINGLLVAFGAVLVITDMADTTEDWHGLAAIFGGFIAAVSLGWALWNFAAMSLAKSSRLGGAIMGAVVPAGAVLLSLTWDQRFLGLELALLLTWFGVSAGFVSEDN